MSKILKELLESRDAAQKAFDDHVVEVRDGKFAGTDEERDAKSAELRNKIVELDERIDEEDEKVTRAAKLADVRKKVLGNPTPQAEVTEPTVYGKGSENSYFMDRAYAAVPDHPLHDEARQRLFRASHEVAVEMVSNPKDEVRTYLQELVREEKRTGGRDTVKAALKRYEELGRTGRSELRTGMDTTSGSGGSFATPIYQIQKYAPYREAGRAFIDQCNGQPLPPYGMEVNIPHVTGPAAVAAQTEGNAVTETDPTAGYLTASLTTEAGQVTVSQQLMDRVGPGFSFDTLVFDQLNRDYAPKVDTLVLNSALSGAGVIAYTDSTGFHLTSASGAGGFYSKVSGAKSAIRKGAGVFMVPTHLFLDPARWEFISAWADSQGRPVVVPDRSGPFNAVAAGSADGAPAVEGATGYRLNGLPVFNDANIPTPTAGADQAIVGNLDEVYVFEGTPVTRAVPQTKAGNLQVLLQLYSYIAVIVRYPTAVQTVTGTGMATIAF